MIDLTKPRPYSDWFGKGDTTEDIKKVLNEYGNPERIYLDGFMACIIYPDKVIVTGYDSNEYTHYFYFEDKEDPQ